MNKVLMNVLFFFFLIFSTSCLAVKNTKTKADIAGPCTKPLDCKYPYSCYIKVGGNRGYCLLG